MSGSFLVGLKLLTALEVVAPTIEKEQLYAQC